MDLDRNGSEVTSVLVVHCTTTLDVNACHCYYMLYITSLWLASLCHNITTLCSLHVVCHNASKSSFPYPSPPLLLPIYACNI